MKGTKIGGQLAEVIDVVPLGTRFERGLIGRIVSLCADAGVPLSSIRLRLTPDPRGARVIYDFDSARRVIYGTAIRLRRKELGLTIQEVATRMGTSRQYISMTELGLGTTKEAMERIFQNIE